MLLFVSVPTTITEPPGGGGPLTSTSTQRLGYLGFCGLGHSLPPADSDISGVQDRGMFLGLVVPIATPTEPITAASVERLRWMDFCGFDATTMRPDGAISLADQYHFTGLIQGLGVDDEDRLLLLGVS